MESVILLIGAIGGILAIPVGYFTAKMTASSQKESKEIEARGPEWESFLEQVRKENDRAKERMEEHFGGQIKKLADKVERLEAWKQRMSTKYNLSIAVIARWHRKYPHDDLVKNTPQEIREDLPAYWPRDEPN